MSNPAESPAGEATIGVAAVNGAAVKPVAEKPQAAEAKQRPPGTPGPGGRFAFELFADKERLRVSLGASFTVEDWKHMEEFSRKQLGDGRTRWTIDVRALRMLTSRVMGLLIGQNTLLSTRGGSLELVTTRESIVAETLQNSRLGRIMTITEI